MSQVPPPSSMPYPPQGFPPPPQSRTNGAAIASLICGIVGCCTPAGLAAIILGVVGIVISNKPGGTGKGMSITGIVLGCIWMILTIGAIVAAPKLAQWFPQWAGTLMQRPAQEVGTSFISDLAGGRTEAASAMTTSDFSKESLTALGTELKSYGNFKSLAVSNVTLDPASTDGKMHLVITGSLEFDTATKTFEASLTSNPGGGNTPFKIENFKIK